MLIAPASNFAKALNFQILYDENFWQITFSEDSSDNRKKLQSVIALFFCDPAKPISLLYLMELLHRIFSFAEILSNNTSF